MSRWFGRSSPRPCRSAPPTPPVWPSASGLTARPCGPTGTSPPNGVRTWRPGSATAVIASGARPSRGRWTGWTTTTADGLRRVNARWRSGRVFGGPVFCAAGQPAIRRPGGAAAAVLKEALDPFDQRRRVPVGWDRFAERHLDPVAPGDDCPAQPPGPQPAGGHCLGGPGDADRNDRQVVRGGEHGGSAAHPPGDAVARARSLREQQEVPPLVKQGVEVAAVLGQAAAALAL